MKGGEGNIKGRGEKKNKVRGNKGKMKERGKSRRRKE
jgi:hypothetical protein